MPSAIEGYLANILSAVYGEQVRTSIHHAIQQCYSDVTSPSLLKDGIAEILTLNVSNGVIPGAVINDLGLITETTANKFDFSAIEEGYLNSSTGEVANATSSNKNYWTSGFIPVTSGTTYYFKSLARKVMYNSSQEFSANIGDNATSYTPNANGYIRVSLLKTNRNVAAVYEGTNRSTYIPGRSAIDFVLRDDVYRKSEIDTMLGNIDVGLTSEQKAALIALLN